ncbi:MAG: sulfatase-like hydrolase/transferase [Thermoleophilia bacterium]|nr:sulfatase-like hydrolase/transferase [Thermoleophilia bacterium]
MASRAEGLVEDLGVVYLHVLLPDDLAARLPSVSDNWGGFLGDDEDDEDDARERHARAGGARDPARRANTAVGRDRLVEDFIALIEPGARETLYFLHVLLPHRPWTYLPSGKDYGNTNVRTFGQTRRGFWTRDEDLLRQAYQRYLLQLRFVDRLLGRLLDRLEATRLDRTALLVVCADHGLGFTPGGAPRGVQEANVHELAPVPLFIKRPGQWRGRVVERNVETVDVLPAIADALQIRIPWKIDGTSAFDSGLDRRRLRFSGVDPVAAGELERRKHALVEERVDVFGTGADRLRLFRIGPFGDLVGRRVADLPTSDAGAGVAAIDERDRFASVDKSSGFLPAYVTGRLEDGRPGTYLVLALNGRVGAVVRAFELAGETRFAAMLPEELFRAGANEVEIFALDGPPAAPALARLADGP